MQDTERIYEVAVWLRLADDGSVDESLVSRVRDQLTHLGAEILSQTKAAKRRLAYPIANIREGAFVVFDIRMEPSQSGNIISAFRHNQDVIRIGIVKKEEPKHATISRLTTPRREAAAEAQPTSPEKPEVKMEDLEKKLEAILHGNAEV